MEIMMLKKGDKIGIVCCSNGQKRVNQNQIRCLEETLHSMGVQPVFSEYIYEKESVFSGADRQRAEALMQFYRDDEIRIIKRNIRFIRIFSDQLDMPIFLEPVKYSL